MTQQDDVQPDEKNVTAEPQDADADAATAEPEAAEAPEPAPAPVKKCRQWVTLRGTSMDARVGRGIVDDIAHDLKSVVGRPHACALLHAPDVSDDVLRTLSRGLSDQGFEVLLAELPSGDACCDLAHADAVTCRPAGASVIAGELPVFLRKGKTLQGSRQQGRRAEAQPGSPEERAHINPCQQSVRGKL